jgi:hypothetical protein
MKLSVVVDGEQYTDRDWQEIREFLKRNDSDWSCLFENENEHMSRLFRKAPAALADIVC